MLNEKNESKAESKAAKRLNALFDEGSFNEIDAFALSNGEQSSVICGFGTVYGSPVYAFAQNIEVVDGAVDRVQASKIKKVYELAAKTGAPIVGIYDSFGAKIDGGIDTLAALGEMLSWSNNISGVVPQISVVAGTCAGTTAMIAAAADIVVMSEEAKLFMTAPSILEAKGDKEETATVKACLKSGVAQLSAKDDMEAVEQARELLAVLPANNLSVAPAVDSVAVAGCEQAFRDLSVEKDALKLIENTADENSVTELSAEFATNAKTALASVDGNTTGFVAFEGVAIDIDACSKVARFVRFCDAFAIPVVTFVDAEGFEANSKAENSGVVRYASMLSNAYAEATCPKISVITGKAIGAAYIALAGKGSNADFVIAWADAVISALEPISAVSMLWNDRISKGETREDLVEEYSTTLANAFSAAANGNVDDVIDPALTRAKLINTLNIICGKRVSTLPKKHSNMPL
ncbi:MAG: carboxyl transferase [Clostridiales bacterium]|nr:carboxyl transferase [Clostridiales bacterium]